MTADKYTRWEDLVRKVARFTSWDFTEVDWEDLFQDLMMYVLENHKMIDPDARYAAKHLQEKATEIAWKYRKQQIAGSQYLYRTSDVKKILTTLFRKDMWTQPLEMDLASVTLEDRVMVHSDVSAAFDRLPQGMRIEILTAYLQEYPEDGAGRKRLSRAVERLTDILNFYRGNASHEGVGARRVIGNARAAYQIQLNTEG